MKELIAIAQEMQPRTMAARDWVFQILRTAIVRNKLPGGMPLRQDEVCLLYTSWLLFRAERIEFG